MISYYPNVNHLNEAFDKAFTYEQGNPEEEKVAQRIYELCAKIYEVGFKDGVDKMTGNVIRLLRERGYAQDTDNAGR